MQYMACRTVHFIKHRCTPVFDPPLIKIENRRGLGNLVMLPHDYFKHDRASCRWHRGHCPGPRALKGSAARESFRVVHESSGWNIRLTFSPASRAGGGRRPRLAPAGPALQNGSSGRGQETGAETDVQAVLGGLGLGAV